MYLSCFCVGVYRIIPVCSLYNFYHKLLYHFADVSYLCCLWHIFQSMVAVDSVFSVLQILGVIKNNDILLNSKKTFQKEEFSEHFFTNSK